MLKTFLHRVQLKAFVHDKEKDSNTSDLCVSEKKCTIFAHFRQLAAKLVILDFEKTKAL